jgi:hypothetical protein
MKNGELDEVTFFEKMVVILRKIISKAAKKYPLVDQKEGYLTQELLTGNLQMGCIRYRYEIPEMIFYNEKIIVFDCKMGLGISVQVLIRLFEGEISDYAFVS